MMHRLLGCVLLMTAVGCASAPKKTEPEKLVVDPKVAALEPFLDSLEADEEAAEEEGRAARRRLRTGRMLLAGKPIDEVLQTAKDRGEPILVHAVLLARKGDFQGALTAARSAGGLKGVQLALAILLNANEVDAAKQVVAQAQDDEGAPVLSAWMTHRAGQSKEAIEALRKHLFNKGRDLFAYTTLARIHAEQGELRLARLVCKEGLKQAPRDADLHYLLGTIEQSRGRQVAATRAFKAALKVDPGHLGALLERARQDIVGFDYGGALRSTERAVRLAPGDAETILLHALALRANGRCDDAQALLEQLSDKKPVALFNLGVLHLRCHNDAKTAFPIFKSFVEKTNPDDGHPVHNLLVEAEALAE